MIYILMSSVRNRTSGIRGGVTWRVGIGRLQPTWQQIAARVIEWLSAAVVMV